MLFCWQVFSPTIVESYGHNINRRGRSWVGSEAGDYPLQASDLGTILQPLSGYLENLLIPTGIDFKSIRDAGGATAHGSCGAQTLTGSQPFGPGGRARPGPRAQQVQPSIDVRIGDFLNNEYGLSNKRVFPSLYFTNFSDLDKTVHCFGLDGKPVRSRAGLSAIVKTLFRHLSEPSPLDTITTDARRHILSLVTQGVQNIRGEPIGANASTVMDAYRDSVNGLAQQIELTAGSACSAPAMAGQNLDDRDGRTIAHVFDAIYNAMACDLTSSITYAIGGEHTSLMRHAFLADQTDNGAVKDLLGKSAHSGSHQTGGSVDAKQELINTHYYQLIANLLDKMSATMDVDGQSTMLDNTVIFVPTSMGQNVHEVNNLPFLIIAGKNSRLKGGMHYDCGSYSNNQLLATVAQGLTFPDTEVGGYKGHDRVRSLTSGGSIEKMLRSA